MSECEDMGSDFDNDLGGFQFKSLDMNRGQSVFIKSNKPLDSTV